MNARAITAALAALGTVACAELPLGGEPVGAMVVSPELLHLGLGDTVRLEASVTSESGDALPGREVHWSSADHLVVVVSGDGVATAVGAGSTWILAESGGEAAEIPVSVTAQFVHVASGTSHSCGVTTRGAAACWGSNQAGSLGNGVPFSGATPQLVRAPEPLVSVTTGWFHSCGLTAEGVAYCWGRNLSGQLGLGAPDGVAHRRAEAVLTDVRFTRLDGGARHTCGLSTEGTILCWGSDFLGQLGTGGVHTFCGPEACAVVPTPVSGAIAFAAVSAGSEHTCGVSTAGDAYCWGLNEGGQLGDGTIVDRSVPTRVAGDIRFRTISASGLHTCAVSEDLRGYCWGVNADGRLGTGDALEHESPHPIVGDLEVVAVSAGEQHACALATDGGLWCWGFNGWGQLGVPSVQASGVPLRAQGPTFTAIDAGFEHHCGIGTSGVLYCWGRNNNGQLGMQGPSRASPTPVEGQ